MPSSAVPVCGLCLRHQGCDKLVQCASEGSLLSVCLRCFYLRQISELSGTLSLRDVTLEALEDGLRTLYELVRSRAEEVAIAGIQDATESGEGQGQGQGTSGSERGSAGASAGASGPGSGCATESRRGTKRRRRSSSES